jgi:hypothetical protein
MVVFWSVILVATVATPVGIFLVYSFIYQPWIGHRERMAKIQKGSQPELADRMLKLEQEVARLRSIVDPLFQQDERPPLSTDIKKPSSSNYF